MAETMRTTISDTRSSPSVIADQENPSAVEMFFWKKYVDKGKRLEVKSTEKLRFCDKTDFHASALIESNNRDLTGF